jgi:hypothetical protein
MKIPNSPANLSINNQISHSKKAQGSVEHQRDISRVQFNKDDKFQEKQKDRLDIDPQTLDLIQQQSVKHTNQQPAKQTDYDQPSEQNYTAISAYQSVENQSQRDNIKQVFGVDLLA